MSDHTMIRECAMVYRGRARKAPRCLRDSRGVVEYFAWMNNEPKEHFCTLLLNGRHVPISHTVVSVGTLNSSLVHPREVFSTAIIGGAAAIVLVHNHPSGDSSPSSEDDAITQRLVIAGRLLGINVLDHVVIGRPGWYSYREKRGADMDAWKEKAP